MYIFIALALVTGVISLVVSKTEKSQLETSKSHSIATTTETTPPVKTESITENPNLKNISPQPNEVVNSPLSISGEARGNWFFEASFPVELKNWEGTTIATGIATAQGDWMTTDFVPFTASLEFNKVYQADGGPMKRGTLILKKDNPSGLPEHDDALEIPVYFGF